MIVNNNIHICETLAEFIQVIHNREDPILVTNKLAKFILWNIQELPPNE